MDQKHFPSTDPIYRLTAETVERLEAMLAELSKLEGESIL